MITVLWLWFYDSQLKTGLSRHLLSTSGRDVSTETQLMRDNDNRSKTSHKDSFSSQTVTQSTVTEFVVLIVAC